MKLDSHSQFSIPTVFLHWLIAFAMIGMLAFGLYLEDLAPSPDKGELIGLHKSIGVIILLLAALRVAWRVINRFPKPLTSMSGWQAFMAKLAHWALIIGTVLMPVSGIMMAVGGGHSVAVFGWEMIAGSGQKTEWMSQAGHILHGLGGKLLIAFILLHVAGAFKHQWMDKDGTLNRMLGQKVSEPNL